jgi:predicted dehydrogenase
MDGGVAVALIGCGGMGLRHLVGYAELEKRNSGYTRLAGVCDADPRRATVAATLFEELAGRPLSLYENLDEVLADDSIEAVDLVIPTRHHHEAVVQSLRRGRHVMVEKPFGITVRTCDLMHDAATRSGMVLAIAENYRRVPTHRALRAVIAEGVIGDPQVVGVQCVQPSSLATEYSWTKDRRMVGSLPLLELAVHEMDLLRHVIGEVSEVHGALATFGAPSKHAGIPAGDVSEDAAAALLQFRSGALGQVLFKTVEYSGGVGSRLIAGSRGWLDSRRWEGWEHGSIATDGSPPIPSDTWVRDWLARMPLSERQRLLPAGSWDETELIVDVRQPLRYGIGTEIHDFGTAIAERTPPEVGPEDATASVAICLAILESALLGRAVKVANVRSGEVGAWQSTLDQELGLA